MEENVYRISADRIGLKLCGESHRAPDVAWAAHERVAGLSGEERDGFVSLTPDFVIELRSTTDPLDALKNKMNEYVRALAARVVPNTVPFQQVRCAQSPVLQGAMSSLHPQRHANQRFVSCILARGLLH